MVLIVEQIRLVWPARLTLPKVLFFINRYIAFFSTFGMIYGKLRLHYILCNSTDVAEYHSVMHCGCLYVIERMHVLHTGWMADS